MNSVGFGFLAIVTLAASACGGSVDVELGRVGQGAAGSAAVSDSGTGGSKQVPDSGTGGAGTERRADGGGGFGETAGGPSGGSPGVGGASGGASGGAGASTGGAGGNEPSPCQQILIDNSAPGAPAYPTIFVPPTDAQTQAQQRVAEFLAHYGIAADKFKVQIDEMTATPSFATHLVGDPQVPLLEPPEKIETGTFETTARKFFSQWGELFRSNGVTLVKQVTSDSNGDCDEWGRCSLYLAQDYCGYPVMSYWGDSVALLARANQSDSLISQVSDTLVPMIPIYSKPVYSAEQVKASLIGKKFAICSKVNCDGEITITADTKLEASLQVLVRRPDGESYLEYRLAYRVFVEDAVYLYVVDAIEGSILYETTLIIS